MQAPRCIRHTQVTPSQASQLPHLTGYTLDWVHQDPTVGAGLLANAVFQSPHVSLAHRLREQARSHKLTEFSRQHRTALLFCGSGLARDAGALVHKAYPVVAIAGKPAPTFDRVHPRPRCTNPTVGAGLLANAVVQSPHVSLAYRLREQARSHKLTEFSRQHRTAWLFCGSGLARDAGASVHQAYPGDAIAGKPAPKFDRVHPRPRCTKIQLWERACSRMRCFSQLRYHWHTAFASKPAPTS